MRPAWIVRLIEAEEEAPIPPPREADRRAAISAIETAIRMRAQRRSRARLVYGLSAAAAVVLAASAGALVARRHADATVTASTAAPAATITTVSGDGVVVDGETTSTAALAKGGHVAVRAGGHATIALPTGTELALGDRGDLGVVEQGRSQIFSLGAGSVRARVAKLHDGERFVVRTPDAEVEVRGTVFTVSLADADDACGGGTVTRVAVEEGVVVVRRGGVESRVTRGEKWPAGCDALAPPPIAGNDAPSSKPSKKAAPAPTATAPAATASAGSSLAEQNALFSEGINYKNGGQRGEAIASFEKLMSKYPASPLAENAAVERMRLLAQSDRARGATAAQQYLKRYPNGFGRAEAKAIVDSGP